MDPKEDIQSQDVNTDKCEEKQSREDDSVICKHLEEQSELNHQTDNWLHSGFHS